MAQTFIGNLILRLQENVSAGAKKATNALKGVDQAAAGIGRNAAGAANLKRALDGIAASAGKLNAPWGVGLQSQLQRLGASAAELDKVRQSWDQLQARLAAGGISGKLRSNEIAAWRLAVAGNLTAVRAEADRTRQSLVGLGDQVRHLARTGSLLAGGLGTAILGRAGIQASATYEDLKIALEGKNWGADVNKAILAEADRVAARFGQSRATALETLMDAAVSSDKPTDALAKSDTYGRALVLENLYSGPGKAAEGVRNLDKARDGLGIESPEAVRQFFDGYYRAKSILGADLNTDQYRQAIQYARTAGKAVTPEFLATTLPSMIAESKGGDAGTRLRAAFDQFVTGRASKEAKQRQVEMGIRKEDGSLVDEADFRNPIAWVNDVVAKRLEAEGRLKRDADGRVSGDGKVQLAKELGLLTNNRLSSDFLYGMIDQAAQYERQRRQMLNSKGGLDSADKVMAESPTMAWRALEASLQNVASTVGETVMPVIVPGLNMISGAFNSLATSLQAMDPSTVAKLGATGLGLYGITKLLAPAILAKKALDVAGAAGGNAGAAVAGAGGGAAAGAAGAGGAGLAARLLRVARVGGWTSLALGFYDLLSRGYEPEKGDIDTVKPGEAHNNYLKKRRKAAAAWKEEQDDQFQSALPWSETNRETRRAKAFTELGQQKPGVDTSALDDAQAKAAETQTKLAGLNTTVKPGVDTSALREANALLDAALSKLNQLGTVASAAGSRVGSAISRELRAAQSDYGVAP